MKIRWMAICLVGALAVGCVSIADQIPTRQPQGHSASAVARDQTECETYAKAQPKHKGDHYQACMMGRSYGANVDMDHLGWVIGVVQTRPHDTATVMKDMQYCDRRADNVKKSETVTLTPEQERGIAGQGFSTLPGMMYQQRPNATRMLVACLHELGYTVTPWVPVNTAR